MKYTTTRCSLVAVLAVASCAVAIGEPVMIGGKVRESPDVAQLSRAGATRRLLALDKKVVHIHADSVPAYAIFLAQAQAAGFTVGMELLSDADQKPVSIDVSDRNVGEVIDRIYLADQRYTAENFANYVPRQYQLPKAREVGAKSTPKAPPPYMFTTRVPQFIAGQVTPVDAISRLVAIDVVSSQPPSLPVDVEMKDGNPGKVMSYSRGDMYVRTLVNLIATSSGKSWVARTVNGRLSIQLFDRAESVCPDVAKVQVEMGQ